MAKKAAGCTRKKIIIKGKRGRVVAEFMGRTGKECGPRPKPKTGHLGHYKAAMKEIARSCKGKPRKAFLGCMASGLRRS